MMPTAVLRDWWVDGHFITARDRLGARLECRRLYDHRAMLVRRWTLDDEECQHPDEQEIRRDQFTIYYRCTDCGLKSQEDR